MYFKLLLRKVLYVQPVDLTSTINRDVEGFLRSQVEGTRIRDIGLVVAVPDIERVSEGKVLDNGNVAFEVVYIALVHKLFPGEVIDAVVTQVDREGVIATAGAGTIFISKLHISPQYVFELGAGENVSHFALKSGGQKTIENHCVIRVKVIAEMPTSDRYDAMGTMMGDFFGPRP